MQYKQGFLRKRLARAVRELRGQMSHCEFGHRVGLSHSTIGLIERGEQNVTVDTLEQLCRTFKLDIEDLIGSGK